MIIKAIRDYFMDCPLISERSKINIDYLGTRAIEYTIDTIPAPTLISKYMDGGEVKAYTFTFGSREYYGANVLDNIDNSGFYQKLEDWIKEQNSKGIVPELEGNRRSRYIEVLNAGYLFDTTEDNARYQIQLRLIYYEGGN